MTNRLTRIGTDGWVVPSDKAGQFNGAVDHWQRQLDQHAGANELTSPNLRDNMWLARTGDPLGTWQAHLAKGGLLGSAIPEAAPEAEPVTPADPSAPFGEVDWTPTEYKADAGVYDYSGWAGRPDRANPDLFGVNSSARELGQAHNDLMGYAVREDTYGNSENGYQRTDDRITIDPWSGGRIFQDLPVAGKLGLPGAASPYTQVSALNPSGTNFAEARALLEELRGLPPSEMTARLRDPGVQETLSPFAFNKDTALFNNVANDKAAGYMLNQIDRQEAAHNERMAAYNEHKNNFETAWGQIQEEHLSPRLDAQLRELMPDDGKSYDNAFTGNYDRHINTLNYTMRGKLGIDDLRELASTSHDGRAVIYNRRTGQEVDPSLLNYKGGSHDGNVEFRLVPTENGGVTFDTKFNAPSKWAGGGWISQLAPMAFSFALGPVAGALGKALAPTLGAIGQAAVGGALTGGLTSAAFGGNILQGALLGAAGGAASNAAGNAYVGAKGIDPTLMTPSPQIATQAGLVANAAGGATQDLLAGANPIDRYRDPGTWLNGLNVARTLL